MLTHKLKLAVLAVLAVSAVLAVLAVLAVSVVNSDEECAKVGSFIIQTGSLVWVTIASKIIIAI